MIHLLSGFVKGLVWSGSACLLALFFASLIFGRAEAQVSYSVSPLPGDPPDVCRVSVAIGAEDGLLVHEVVPPKAFTTDRCSMWPDGDWWSCCVTHDAAYWCGGSYADRKRADAELARCVGGRLGSLMYAGVRVGGASWLPTPFRWGYGWDWPQAGPK